MDKRKLEDAKECLIRYKEGSGIIKDIFAHGLATESVDWLIRTIELQQKEIERLRIVEAAYEALRKAL